MSVDITFEWPFISSSEGFKHARRTCRSSIGGGRRLSGSLSIESTPRASKYTLSGSRCSTWSYSSHVLSPAFHLISNNAFHFLPECDSIRSTGHSVVHGSFVTGSSDSEENWAGSRLGNNQSSFGIWIRSNEAWNTGCTPRRLSSDGRSTLNELFPKSLIILNGMMNLGASLHALPFSNNMFCVEI